MSDNTSDPRSSCENQITDHGKESLPPTNGAIGDLEPVALVPLKTVLELRAEDAVTDVYITAVPVKSANSVISCAFPSQVIMAPVSNTLTVPCATWLTMPPEWTCTICEDLLSPMICHRL